MKVIATKQWHKILGELWSMSIAILIVIPRARGLFSLLQEDFRHVESSQPQIMPFLVSLTILGGVRIILRPNQLEFPN